MKSINISNSHTRFPNGKTLPTNFLYGFLPDHNLYYVVNPDQIHPDTLRVGLVSVSRDCTHWKSYTDGQAFHLVSDYLCQILRKYPHFLTNTQFASHVIIDMREVRKMCPQERRTPQPRFRGKPDHAQSVLTQRTDFKEVTTEAHWAFRGAASVRANAARYE